MWACVSPASCASAFQLGDWVATFVSQAGLAPFLVTCRGGHVEAVVFTPFTLECCRIFTKHGQMLCAVRHCDTSTVNTNHEAAHGHTPTLHLDLPPPGPASINGALGCIHTATVSSVSRRMVEGVSDVWGSSLCGRKLQPIKSLPA